MIIDIEKIKKDKTECEKSILKIVEQFEKGLPPQIKLENVVVYHMDCKIKLTMEEL